MVDNIISASIMKDTHMKESTKLGNGLGRTARGTVFLMDYLLPLAVIGAYRLMPAKTRGNLFGGPSASLSAMTTLRLQRHGGWDIIRIAMSNHPERPKLP